MGSPTSIRPSLGDPAPTQTFNLRAKDGDDAKGIPAPQTGIGVVGPQGGASQTTPTDTYGNVKCAVAPTDGKQGGDGIIGSLGNQPEKGQDCKAQILNLGLVTGTVTVNAGGGNGGKGGKGGQGGKGGPGGPAGALTSPCTAANQGPGGRGGKGGPGRDGGKGGDTENIVVNFYIGSSGTLVRNLYQGMGGDPGDGGDPGPVGDGGPGTVPGNSLGPGDRGNRGDDGAAGSITWNHVPPS